VALRHLEHAHAPRGTRRSPLREHGGGLPRTAYLASGEPERAAALLLRVYRPRPPRRTFSQRRIWLARAELAHQPRATRPATRHRRRPDRHHPEHRTSAGTARSRASICRAPRRWRRSPRRRGGSRADDRIESPARRKCGPSSGGSCAARACCHDRRGAQQRAARAFDAARLLIEELAATVLDEHTRGIFCGRHSPHPTGVPHGIVPGDQGAVWRPHRPRAEIPPSSPGRRTGRSRRRSSSDEKTVEWISRTACASVGFPLAPNCRLGGQHRLAEADDTHAPRSQ